jgi:hypothetical protein
MFLLFIISGNFDTSYCSPIPYHLQAKMIPLRRLSRTSSSRLIPTALNPKTRLLHSTTTRLRSLSTPPSVSVSSNSALSVLRSRNSTGITFGKRIESRRTLASAATSQSYVFPQLVSTLPSYSTCHHRSFDIHDTPPFGHPSTLS